MLLVVRGTALFITDGFPQRTWSAERPAGSPSCWSATSTSAPFRVYMSLFWFVAAAIVLGYVLTQTKAGNWIQASGGNPDAARARGVNVDRTKIALFMLTSVHGGLRRHHQLDPHLGRQSRTAAPATSSR